MRAIFRNLTTMDIQLPFYIEMLREERERAVVEGVKEWNLDKIRAMAITVYRRLDIGYWNRPERKI